MHKLCNKQNVKQRVVYNKYNEWLKTLMHIKLRNIFNRVNSQKQSLITVSYDNPEDNFTDSLECINNDNIYTVQR